MKSKMIAYRIFIELGVQPDGTFQRGVSAVGETPMLGDGDLTDDALAYAHAANVAIWQSKAMAEAAQWSAQWSLEVARCNASPKSSRMVH